ncbi:hypothetical protein V6N13_080280 [Hibiscus sabdariffa]|uniref:Uncharacterized protein n=2 Tax=Hibiscus sabdariffa TaxID=183260 RepID=A0ABR2PY08_9ROSI
MIAAAEAPLDLCQLATVTDSQLEKILRCQQLILPTKSLIFDIYQIDVLANKKEELKLSGGTKAAGEVSGGALPNGLKKGKGRGEGPGTHVVAPDVDVDVAMLSALHVKYGGITRKLKKKIK